MDKKFQNSSEDLLHFSPFLLHIPLDLLPSSLVGFLLQSSPPELFSFSPSEIFLKLFFLIIKAIHAHYNINVDNTEGMIKGIIKNVKLFQILQPRDDCY